MKHLVLIFLFAGCICLGQDKLFLKNGTVKKGVVVSMGSDFVFFKTSDSSYTIRKLAKAEIIMVEKYDGKVYIFSKQEQLKDTNKLADKTIYHHSIGLQPFNVLLGRITGTYEYLNKAGTIGFLIPLSLTFDPSGVIYNVKTDSTIKSANHTKGFNFISGADVNFYIGKGDFEGFYIGPRIRYGTDMFLSNIEAYSVQTQFGWRMTDQEDRISQHFSVGFGFVRILSSPAGKRINSKQSYGWLSFNYRIGLNW